MTKITDKSDWAIGGGIIAGVGAGMFFVRENPLAFVACLLLGLGLGLVMTSLISKNKN